MNNLTEKEYVNVRISDVKRYIKFNEREDDKDFFAHKELELYQKAQKYIELTDELGYPLEVVLKALKSNVWNDKTKRQEWVVLDYSNGEFILKSTKELYIDDNKSILPLKDYGKTWWLKGDKCDDEKNRKML